MPPAAARGPDETAGEPGTAFAPEPTDVLIALGAAKDTDPDPAAGQAAFVGTNDVFVASDVFTVVGFTGVRPVTDLPRFTAGAWATTGA